MLTIEIGQFALELGWRHLFLRVPGIGEAWAEAGDRGFQPWAELRRLEAAQGAARAAFDARLEALAKAG